MVRFKSGAAVVLEITRQAEDPPPLPGSSFPHHPSYLPNHPPPLPGPSSPFYPLPSLSRIQSCSPCAEQSYFQVLASSLIKWPCISLYWPIFRNFSLYFILYFSLNAKTHVFTGEGKRCSHLLQC